MTLGCTDATGPRLPRAVAFEAPTAYRGWWVDVERCSQRRGSLEAIRFYRVLPMSGQDSLLYRDPESGRFLLGEWVPGANLIYLTAGQVASRQVVRHEMLHALLEDVSHPRRYFIDRCGPLVSY